MKIKKIINVLKTIDVEINVPYFCKSYDGCSFYKVMNNDGHYIAVTTYDFSKGIDFQKNLHEALVFRHDNVEITEEEFNTAFNEVMDFLKTPSDYRVTYKKS